MNFAPLSAVYGSLITPRRDPIKFAGGLLHTQTAMDMKPRGLCVVYSLSRVGFWDLGTAVVVLLAGFEPKTAQRISDTVAEAIGKLQLQDSVDIERDCTVSQSTAIHVRITRERGFIERCTLELMVATHELVAVAQSAGIARRTETSDVDLLNLRPI